MIFDLLLRALFVNPGIINAADCEKLRVQQQIVFITKHDLDECLPLYGRNPLDISIAENIWRAIKKAYHGIDGIPLSVYRNMGWTLSGISLLDLENMIIDQAELIKIFGSAESLKDDQMNIIAQKVKTDWANKTPEKYSEYDLEILGKILCYFDPTDILKIHPDAYRAASKSIGKLNSCPHEIIESFAKLAVQENAYGKPSKWNKLDISEIGVVIAGLSEAEYNSIKMENLTQNKRIYNQVYSSRHPNKNSTIANQHNLTKSGQIDMNRNNNSFLGEKC